MPKFKKKTLSKKQSNIKLLETHKGYVLLQAFLCIDSVQLMKQFLADLLTTNELIGCINRFYAADRLSNDASYEYLADVHGISSRTVSKIAKKLKNINGGLNQVLSYREKSKQNQMDKWIEDELKKLKF